MGEREVNTVPSMGRDWVPSRQLPPIAKNAAAPVVKKVVTAVPLKPIIDSFTKASLTE
jgi:hypothetical protein